MADQLNILLITSDQQRADCFGFENTHIRTPYLDLLATQGTRFSACITPNLVCQPGLSARRTHGVGTPPPHASARAPSGGALRTLAAFTCP